MKGERVDPERLAALIDGRLDADERQALLERLASSPEDRETYADVLAVLGEEERAAAPAVGDELAARRAPAAPARTRAPLLALAAMLAIVAFAVLLWPRLSAGPGTGAGGFDAIALVSEPRVAEGGAWDAPPWRARRADADVLDRQARSTRVGVHLAALELALRAGDDAVAVQAARELSVLLEGFSGGAPAASIYRSLADRLESSPGVADELLAQGREAALAVAEEDWLHLGVWGEAARAAASSGDGDFFESPAGVRAMALALDVDAAPEVIGAIERVREAAADPAGPDLESMREALDDLLRAAGG